MTANGAYNQTPEATELTMIIWWCMGVTRSRTMHIRMTKRVIKIRNKNVGDSESELSPPLWSHLRVPAVEAEAAEVFPRGYSGSAGNGTEGRRTAPLGA
jgi:hypothetical protein